MKIKLSLKRSSGRLVDIVITADSTATVADIARTIAETDPMSTWGAVASNAALTLAVAPPTDAALVQLPADLLIGEAKVGSGFIAMVTTVDERAPERGSAAAILRVHAGPDAFRALQRT